MQNKSKEVYNTNIIDVKPLCGSHGLRCAAPRQGCTDGSGVESIF